MATERLLGAGLILVGGGGIAVALQFSTRTFNNDPGPQLFPILACAILLICGAGLIVTGGRDATPKITPQAFGRGAIMAGLLVLYALGLWLVGFHIATLLGTYAFYHVIAGPEKRVIWRGAVYAVLVTLAVHLMFATLLGAWLPHGLWL